MQEELRGGGETVVKFEGRGIKNASADKRRAGGAEVEGHLIRKSKVGRKQESDEYYEFQMKYRDLMHCENIKT